jgi:diadenosine tetraphosphate (Ap4A) HIT family hydrolase
VSEDPCIEACLACDLASGRVHLPGGPIHETPAWLVEHCVGPLGLGALVVKPRRHVVRVSELEPAEADELGGILRLAAAAVDALIRPDQVYVTLWSHAGGRSVHIHWVVQPVTRELTARYDGLHGPSLQAAMFERHESPDDAEVEAVAQRLRGWFAGV